jgi:hypothetical protein
MSTKKQKIPKLTEQQYNAYIATLKGDAALYNGDGSYMVPPSISEKTTAKIRKK